MALKLLKPQDLQGKEVKIVTKDRWESEFVGNLVQIDPVGVLINYSDHGRDFTAFIPLQNIDAITHKHVSVDTK